MKNFLKILILPVVAIVMLAGFTSPALAQVPPLQVIFENSPLFSESNFIPGDSVTRFVTVKNNSGVTGRIAVETINVADPDDLGDHFDLVIKEGETTLFNGTLSQLFDAGQYYLSDLATGSETQYDFSVTFKPESGDESQGKQLGFDFLVGFEGINGVQNGGPTLLSTNTTGGGGGGGGGSNGIPGGYHGLLITNEAVIETKLEDDNTATAIIAWLTNYAATSQVIYGDETGGPYSLDISAPNFGYPNSTPEDPTKVTSHNVVITGLAPGVTYRYRVVSHASPATVGYEKTFAVLTPEQQQAQQGGVAIATGGGFEVAQGNESPNDSGNEIADSQSEGEFLVTSGETDTIISTNVGGTEVNDGEDNSNLAAALGNLPAWLGDNIYWIIIVVIILIIIIVIWKRRD